MTIAMHVPISLYPSKHIVLVTSKRIEIERKTIRRKGKRAKEILKNQSNRRKAKRPEVNAQRQGSTGRDPEIEKDFGRKTGEI